LSTGARASLENSPRASAKQVPQSFVPILREHSSNKPVPPQKTFEQKSAEQLGFRNSANALVLTHEVSQLSTDTGKRPYPVQECAVAIHRCASRQRALRPRSRCACSAGTAGAIRPVHQGECAGWPPAAGARVKDHLYSFIPFHKHCRASLCLHSSMVPESENDNIRLM